MSAMRVVFVFLLLSLECVSGAEVAVVETGPSPVPFSRELQTLTIREFELFREAQAKLEDEKEKRAALALLSAQQSFGDKLIALEAATKAQFAAGEKALDLATEGIQTHLTSLNGEQARLAADRERFISRESYDVAQKEFGIWRDQVNAALSIGAGRDRGIGLSWGVIVGLIGAIVAVISIVLALRRRETSD